MAAPCTIVKRWKTSQMFISEHTHTHTHTHTTIMEYYSAVKRNEVLIHATT
jgi:hypothetical protein